MITGVVLPSPPTGGSFRTLRPIFIPAWALPEGVSLGNGYPLLADPGGSPRVLLPYHILGHLYTTRVLTGSREDRCGHLTGDL